MILITGATGELGRETIDALLQKIPADQISGLVRDIAKAKELISKGINIKEGNYDDYSSLISAFTGVEKILLISAHAFMDRAAQHKNVINAAVEAGVKHIFYTSIERSSDFILPEVTESDLETENYLKNAGINYTILYNNYYLDGITTLTGNEVLQKGINVPAGTGKTAFIARTDLAAATAEVLTTSGHENKEYSLSGSESYSFQDIAELLSELSGTPVIYTSVTPEEYTAQIVANGVPEPIAKFLTGWAEAIKSGMLETSGKDTEQLIGRKTQPIREALKSIYFPE